MRVPQRFAWCNLLLIKDTAALRRESHLNDAALVLVVFNGERVRMLKGPANVDRLIKRDHISVALSWRKRPVRRENCVRVVGAIRSGGVGITFKHGRSVLPRRIQILLYERTTTAHDPRDHIGVRHCLSVANRYVLT